MCLPATEIPDNQEPEKKPKEKITALDRLIEYLQGRPESVQETPNEEM